VNRSSSGASGWVRIPAWEFTRGIDQRKAWCVVSTSGKPGPGRSRMRGTRSTVEEGGSRQVVPARQGTCDLRSAPPADGIRGRNTRRSRRRSSPGITSAPITNSPVRTRTRSHRGARERHARRLEARPSGSFDPEIRSSADRGQERRAKLLPGRTPFEPADILSKRCSRSSSRHSPGPKPVSSACAAARTRPLPAPGESARRTLRNRPKPGSSCACMRRRAFHQLPRRLFPASRPTACRTLHRRGASSSRDRDSGATRPMASIRQ